MFDQPVLVGLRDTGRSAVAADVSRWEGDQIAIVVAESADAADLGAERLDVEWEDLPVVPDIDAALTGDVMVRPDLHPDSNIYVTYRLRKGDTAAGWDAGRRRRRGDVRAAVPGARLPAARGRGQLDRRRGSDHGRRRRPVDPRGPGADRPRPRPPAERVRVVYPAIGGAFGGREDMSLQIVMALASWRLADRGERRPIRCQWSREESMVGHHKRHRGRVHARWGATADGRVVVAEADGPPRRRRLQLHDQQGAREPPPVRVRPVRDPPPGRRQLRRAHPRRARRRLPRLRRTAGRVRGRDPDEQAGRAPGHGPGRAAPAQPAARRVPRPDGHRDAARRQPARWSSTAAPTPPAGPSPSPPAEAPSPFASLPAQPDALRRGRGFACGFKNVGFSFGFPERCEARLVLHGDDDVDHVELFHAGAEVGQGSHTAFLQMAAEAVGVPVERVEATFSDTASAGDAGSASASRLTFMSGNAILGAAEEAEKRWRAGDRPAVGQLPLRPAAHRAPRRRRQPGHPQLRLHLRRAGRGADGRHRDRAHRRRRGGLRGRRRPGHQPGPGRGPDRGRRRPGPRLRHHRGPPGARRPDPQPPPLHLPDARDPGHPPQGHRRSSSRSPTPAARGARGASPRSR